MKKIFVLFLFSMSFVFFTGCGSSPSASVSSLDSLVDLSPSHIASIKHSQGGGKQTILENPAQKEDICACLSSIFVQGRYTERIPPQDSAGGLGDYLLITYMDGSTTHIQFHEGSEEIQLYGKTIQDETQGKWRVYSLAGFPDQESWNAIFSMSPIE